MGYLPEGHVSDITMRMRKIEAHPFSLTTSRFHFFGHRIMYLGFEHSPEILALRREMLRIYPEFYPSEEKEFVPHLTVKRGTQLKHLPPAPAALSMEVSGLALFKSEKDSGNGKYHVIQRVSF